MDKKEKKIIFTGGGSAGHVTVNLALLPRFQNDGWSVRYIGSRTGIEKELIEPTGIPYDEIATGKLRRYFDVKNFKDPFKVIGGIAQAFKIMKREKPHVVFSKGGFVSVPVVIGAWLNRIPVVIHESDMTPGLANKIAMPFATKLCTQFPETQKALNSDKSTYVGAVVRDELKKGNADKGRRYCDFTKMKPVLLIMGGSLGARKINEAVRAQLGTLLETFQIIHVCGKGQIDDSINRHGYRQFEYITDELPHIMAMADIVLSRSGANSIFEFLAMKKPMLLIPLSKQASRGDQILNARSFEKMGYADVLLEENLNETNLVEAIKGLYNNRGEYLDHMEQEESIDPTDTMVQIIKNTSR